MSLWVTAIALMLAALVQSLVIGKKYASLRTLEQRFRFHELRDHLQLLAVEKQIATESQVYRFLLSTINLSIHNAGNMKLSELLRISQAMKQRVRSSAFEEVQEELKISAPEVRVLASDVFTSFALMLVVNDDITYWLFQGFRLLTRVANEAVIRCVRIVASKLALRRVEVVREATDYDHLGQRLVTCH
jgi:hypothetical protein